MSGWVDSCSYACLCQTRLLTEDEEATPVAGKSRKSPEVVDKNQGGQRIKSDEETVVHMKLENIFFPTCLTKNSQGFPSKYVPNESCICYPYVMTMSKIYLEVQGTWLGTIRNIDCYIFLQ